MNNIKPEKRIKVFREHIEAKIGVSEQMKKDYIECSEKINNFRPFKRKKCKGCSWDKLGQIAHEDLCCLKEMEVLLEGKQ